MTGTGALVAASMPERGTALIGIFTFYLVATAWLAARRRDGVARSSEYASLAVSTACAATFIVFSIIAAGNANGRLDSLPAAAHYPFAVVAAIAAALDLNFILRRRLSGSQRIGRHLWRMCTALLIAALSFFLGQQKVMPEAIQGSPLLFIPPLAVFGAMIFWIVRVRFAKAWSRGRSRLAAGMTPPARAEGV
ncbi:MAG TPA: hypothetical protein VK403_11975 [Allosphingosinicella sp.]|nr:hypothetical protein [Allosphingosinicella sp.]